ncbi:MAG: cellulase family glycosylhydrolase [Anaerolineae bacterium]
MKWYRSLATLLLAVGTLVLLSACEPSAVAQKPTLMPLPTFDERVTTETPVPATATPITPTPDARNVEQLCFDLDKFWNNNWIEVINALERVHAEEATCGDKDPAQMLYPAYYNYGVLLQRRGAISEAIAAYQRALEYNPGGAEAAQALKALNAFTPAPLDACDEEAVATALSAIPVYIPQGRGGFVKLAANQFAIEDQPFRVRGVNYYPSRAPWRRFLTETNLTTAAMELDLIKSAGLNTIRIFLWYEAMFNCPASGLVPIASAFERLDGVLKLAAARDLKVIITLNDLPDLTVRPLYTHPETSLAQTLYITMRYRDERTILAWDLRNEGDIDYTRYKQRSTDVLNWLRNLSQQVRLTDPNHLITAGWLSNPLPTDQAVDFFSFHHWSTGAELRRAWRRSVRYRQSQSCWRK